MGLVIWLTGLPCSGKTTLANKIRDALVYIGYRVHQLDGDDFRKKYCKDLGFSKDDREKNLERVIKHAKHFLETEKNQFYDDDAIAVCSFVSPYEMARCHIEESIEYEGDKFCLIYVKCDVKECMKRDVKGMWKKAKEGKIKGFTGYDDPYETPLSPNIVVNTSMLSVEECISDIFNELCIKGLV